MIFSARNRCSADSLDHFPRPAPIARTRAPPSRGILSGSPRFPLRDTGARGPPGPPPLRPPPAVPGSPSLRRSPIPARPTAAGPPADRRRRRRGGTGTARCPASPPRRRPAPSGPGAMEDPLPRTSGRGDTPPSAAPRCSTSSAGRSAASGRRPRGRGTARGRGAPPCPPLPAPCRDPPGEQQFPDAPPDESLPLVVRCGVREIEEPGEGLLAPARGVQALGLEEGGDRRRSRFVADPRSGGRGRARPRAAAAAAPRRPRRIPEAQRARSRTGRRWPGTAKCRDGQGCHGFARPGRWPWRALCRDGRSTEDLLHLLEKAS